MLYSLRFQARDLSVQFCTTAMSRGERKRGGADRRTKSPGNGRVEERERESKEGRGEERNNRIHRAEEKREKERTVNR